MPATSHTTPDDRLDEIARLLAVLIRRRAASQNEAILELRRVGVHPKAIDELLSAAANTVSTTIAGVRKKSRER